MGIEYRALGCVKSSTLETSEGWHASSVMSTSTMLLCGRFVTEARCFLHVESEVVSGTIKRWKQWCFV